MKKSAVVMVTSVIFLLVVTGAMSAMVTILQRDAKLHQRMRVVSEGQRLASFLSTSTRLSSSTEMFFHPEDGPHYAVSYPVPAMMDAGNLPVDEDGRVIRGETVVVHGWPAENPTELRLTRFSPRDNSLTHAERQEQLDHVVQHGNGAGTYNGSNSDTRTMARMSPRFEFTSGGGTYNFYAESPQLQTGEVLGGARIQPGKNTLHFRTTGKSSSSAGHGMQFDRFRLSPTGLAIEAEALFPPTSQYGATAVIEENPTGHWSDRRSLAFPAATVGAELTLEFFNDTWFETLFVGKGSELENCYTYMNSDPGKVGIWLKPSGRDTIWNATFQAEAEAQEMEEDWYQQTAVRVVVRGERAPGGGLILTDGDGCTVRFRASDQPGLNFHILHAFISEAADHENPGPDVSNPTTHRLQFGTPGAPRNDVLIQSGQSVETLPADFPVDAEKSYVISYYVAQSGNPYVWGDETGNTQAYLLRLTSPPPETLTSLPVWSQFPELEPSPWLPGVEEINSTHVNEAVFTSRIVDTTLDAPVFQRLDWEAYQPDDTAVTFRIRTSDTPDMEVAPDHWENVSTLTSPGTISVNPGRYVQIQATLKRDKTQDSVPELRNFSLRWLGEPAYIEFGGDFIRHPSGGVAEILVNEVPPVASFRAELRLTSQHAATPEEIEAWTIVAESTPRN
ncbi:MAG: hypothetical protein LAT83_20060 [Kiritimatiellae bacterium]|nr:hypothetical protein [Kiritimatiellia bacterium]